MKVALTPAPAMNSLPNKYNGMRSGVQVSFEERNPTRDLAPYSQYVDLILIANRKECMKSK